MGFEYLKERTKIKIFNNEKDIRIKTAAIQSIKDQNFLIKSLKDDEIYRKFKDYIIPNITNSNVLKNIFLNDMESYYSSDFLNKIKLKKSEILSIFSNLNVKWSILDDILSKYKLTQELLKEILTILIPRIQACTNYYCSTIYETIFSKINDDKFKIYIFKKNYGNFQHRDQLKIYKSIKNKKLLCDLALSVDNINLAIDISKFIDDSKLYGKICFKFINDNGIWYIMSKIKDDKILKKLYTETISNENKKELLKFINDNDFKLLETKKLISLDILNINRYNDVFDISVIFKTFSKITPLLDMISHNGIYNNRVSNNIELFLSDKEDKNEVILDIILEKENNYTIKEHSFKMLRKHSALLELFGKIDKSNTFYSRIKTRLHGKGKIIMKVME